mgnify:CR=1 FL=1
MSSDSVADAWLNRELALRLVVFLTLLTAMTLWEAVAARRAQAASRLRRWPANVAVAVLGSLLTRAVAPAGAVGFALFAEVRGWGLLQLVGWPAWLEGTAAVVTLDFAIYRRDIAAKALRTPNKSG